MFNYPGEYVQLPWAVFSTTLGSMSNYPGEYIQLPRGVCSTTLLSLPWGVFPTTLGSISNYPGEYFSTIPGSIFNGPPSHIRPDNTVGALGPCPGLGPGPRAQKHRFSLGKSRFLYAGFTAAPRRERQLDASGRPTQQEPFARALGKRTRVFFAGLC